MARIVLVSGVLAVLAVAPQGASAAKRPPADPLWATVNVCDTARHPNAIGIRASMPGARAAGIRLFARFRVQWRDPADRMWHNLLQGGDSGYVALGRVPPGGSRQAGRIFRYQAPPDGTTQLLRGRVDVQWRSGRRVVRHAMRLTTAGHRSAAGSDPKGHSAATCTLRAP